MSRGRSPRACGRPCIRPAIDRRPWRLRSPVKAMTDVGVRLESDLRRLHDGSAYWVERALPPGFGPRLDSHHPRADRAWRTRGPSTDDQRRSHEIANTLGSRARRGSGARRGHGARRSRLEQRQGRRKWQRLGGQPATASQIYLDEIKDYGVCRGADPDLLQRVGQRLDRRTSRSASSSGAAPQVRGTPTSDRRCRRTQPAPERQRRRPDGAHRMGGGARDRRRLHRGPVAVPPERLPGGRVPRAPTATRWTTPRRRH